MPLETTNKNNLNYLILSTCIQKDEHVLTFNGRG
jgi:hypothetical protein